jgi:hypothetical protein
MRDRIPRPLGIFLMGMALVATRTVCEQEALRSIRVSSERHVEIPQRILRIVYTLVLRK